MLKYLGRVQRFAFAQLTNRQALNTALDEELERD